MRRLLVMFAIPLLVLSACGETTKEEIADVLLISQDNGKHSRKYVRR